jgi:hypothetical protein
MLAPLFLSSRNSECSKAVSWLQHYRSWEGSMDNFQEQAKSTARVVGETVGHKVEEVAERSREAGAESVARAARTAEAIADQVAGEVPAVAEYVRAAAQKINGLADDLREKKVGELLTSAAEFGRSQPVVMLAGAALVGFALSRLIKAGVAGASDSKDGGENVASQFDPMKDLS